MTNTEKRKAIEEYVSEIAEKKETWPEGVWNNEPDRVEWRAEFNGKTFPCLLIRNWLGTWCGYVAVDSTHPYYNKNYSEERISHLNCHGGLTYASFCGGSIYHIPLGEEEDKVFWFGFDAAHSGDLIPGMPFREKLTLESLSWETYRDLNYMENQTDQLAQQLSEVKIKFDERCVLESFMEI